ncbi:hypothetical protein JXA05_03765 [Candidatus Peregrinibacteria bacterium]|nr:hypothetical protein [Candidatus Peregrinibacteria bacterium]
MAATPQATNLNPKEQASRLENELKAAYSAERFAEVKTLAMKLTALDPKNRVAALLLEKTVKAEKKAAEKVRAKKVADYETMLAKLFKEGNHAQCRTLAGELKAYAPENKSSAKWLEKINGAEAEAKKKANAAKIKALEEAIGAAFKAGRFEEVKSFAMKMNELDPKNKYAAKIVGKIGEAKAEAAKMAQEEKLKAEKLAIGQKKKMERAMHAEKINVLQDQLKKQFNAVKFTDMRDTAQKLFELDKENAFAKKYLKKAEIIELKAKGLYVSPWSKVMRWLKPAKKEAKAVAAPLKPAAAPAPSPAKVAVSKPAVAVPAVVPKVTAAPAPTPAAPSPLKVAAHAPFTPVVKAPEAKPAETGNVFTKLFGKKAELKPVVKPTKSIIDTIVAKTPEKAAVKVKKEQRPGEGVGMLKFGKAFLQFAVIFILLSAGFFYVENMDVNNRVLGLVSGYRNYASRLHAAAQDVDAKKAEEEKTNADIKKFKQGYNNQYEQMVQNIIDARMNWPDILAKINEVTNSVYEGNELSQYVKYNNYSFDAEKGTVTVSGTLSDPLGKNLAKMVELEIAFRNYPKNPDNPEDKTKPYFYDFKEFRSLSKTLDKKTGKYTSSFQLSFALKPSQDK